MVIAVGNTPEGLAGALLVNRFARGRVALWTASGMFTFALLAAGVASLVSATVGVAGLGLGGYARSSSYGAVWLTWWLGGAGGMLLAAPPLALWSERLGAPWPKARLVEAGCLFAAVVVTGQVVFGALAGFALRDVPLDFLCLPVLAWLAFRLGPRVTSLATALLAGLAIRGTLHGLWPFAAGALNGS